MPPDSPLAMDRTEELRAILADAPVGSEITLVLEEFDYIQSPVSTKRRIYGPAVLYVRQFGDGGVDVRAQMSGTMPRPPLPSAAPVER